MNPAGSCPGTTLGPIPPLGEPPGDALPTIRQLFGSIHGIGYLGFCAVSDTEGQHSDHQAAEACRLHCC